MQIGLLFFFLFSAFHFGFAVPLPGGLFLPQVAFVGVMLVLVWRRPDPVVIFTATFGSALLLAFVILASDSKMADPMRRALSGGQLIYTLSICAVVATAQPFAPEQAQRLSRLLMGAATALSIAGLIEIFTPLSAVSDAFRHAVYKTGLYSADARDFSIAGFVRPKVFASEPSHAAWSVCQLVLCALAFWPSRKNLVFGLAVLALATLVFVSANTVVALIFVAIMLVLLHAARVGVERRRAGVFMVVMVMSAFAAIAASSIINARYDSYFGFEHSFFVRIIQPFDLAWLALKYNAAVGIGYGGLEAIWTQITVIEGGTGAQNINQTPGMALLTIPLYTGLAGTCIFLFALVWVYRRSSGRVGLACVAVLLFMLLQKQSFVITTAWLVAACWILQLAHSLRAVEAEYTVGLAKTQQRRIEVRQELMKQRRQIMRP